MNKRLRLASLILMVMLLVLSVPWYKPENSTGPGVFGFPGWVVIAFGCYILLTLVNALLWLTLPYEGE